MVLSWHRRPSFKKSKSPSAATVGLFALLALPHGSVIAGSPANPVLPFPSPHRESARTLTSLSRRRSNITGFSRGTEAY